MKYNFKKLEKKWQKKWAEKKVFEVDVRKKAKKFYLMEMFPYPSALGLHLGHALNYTIGDILARFKRMRGFNVLYPMGFDALGLPAENAAIKAGTHPKPYTAQAIKNYIKQMKNLGLSYDWSKLVNTMEPEYYKWNQLFFLKFLEKGLAYRKKSAVNWCPECNSVLANEQVHNGRCWRHEETEVEIKHLEQWFLKITDYADELLEGIDDLQWPQKIKTMQKNWIGKSYGTEIDFEIEENISNVVIVHGGNDSEEEAKEGEFENMRHWQPWIKKKLETMGIKVSAELYPRDWSPDYNAWKKVFEKNEINKNSVLVGHSDGGSFLVRWLGETKQKIKKLILIAPWKIDSYNRTNGFYEYDIDREIKNRVDEIVIFTSSNKRGDGKKSIEIFNNTLDAKLIELKGRGHFTLGDMKTKEFPELLERIMSNKKFPVFTTRPDTIYGVTFMVVSAQHEKLMELITKEQKKQVEKFLHKIKSVSEKEQEVLEKEGVWTGSYAVNPLTKEKIPVYAGNFVVAEYGSGMVMGVPAHDQRDFDFAKKYGLEIKEVVSEKRNCIIVHGSNYKDRENIKKYGLPPQNERHWIPWIKHKLEKKNIQTFNPLMPKNWKEEYEDWKIEFEKNDINKDSILVGHSSGADFLVRWLGETGRKVKKLILVAPGKLYTDYSVSFTKFCNFEIDSKIKNNIEEIIIFVSDNDLEVIFKSAKLYEKKLNAKLIELKGRGHFIERHMGTKEFPELLEKIIELNQAYTGKGVLINSDKFNRFDNEKAKQEITKFLEKKKLGRKSVQFKMRDWLISRQRYWGTPIPVVYCDKCGIVPVDEKDLPVILPEKVKFGKGNPLATNKKFVNVKCPRCKGKARRETDTMDTFVDSSWYFMRYPDNKNSKEPFDKKIEADWLPVDQYIGGIEHAIMHLLYARFWTKALRDLGYVNYDEPFTKLFNQGMLHGEDGEKMSKSKGNVIMPEVVSEKYGIDTARFFLMSLAAPDKPRDWSDKGVQGSLKFINKVMEKFGTQGCTPKNIQKNIFTKGIKIGKSSKKIESKLNKTIKEVTNQIENFKYNLAVIKIRDLFNSLGEEESKDVLEKSLKLLHVFCPHITEELWSKLGNKLFISLEKWPVADEKKINEKFEKQEQAVEKLKSDIEQIKKLTGHHPTGMTSKERGLGRTPKDFGKKSLQGAKKEVKVYVYVLPNELKLYSEIKDIEIFAVNDKKKYDPENKSKKVKPGRPGIYLE